MSDKKTEPSMEVKKRELTISIEVLDFIEEEEFDSAIHLLKRAIDNYMFNRFMDDVGIPEGYDDVSTMSWYYSDEEE